LIEVLAALVIVALGMLGVIEAVTQATRNGTYLRDKTLAHWIAMNLITERRLEPTPPDTTETKGDVDYAGQRWHWTMKVTQTQVDSLRRMDVSVRAEETPDGTALASVTGFYGTAIGPAGGRTLAWAGTGAPGPGDGKGGAGNDAGNGTGNGNGNGNADDEGNGDANGEDDGAGDNNGDGNDDADNDAAMIAPPSEPGKAAGDTR
jgi:general secretion pathway protein I